LELLLRKIYNALDSLINIFEALSNPTASSRHYLVAVLIEQSRLVENICATLCPFQLKAALKGLSAKLHAYSDEIFVLRLANEPLWTLDRLLSFTLSSNFLFPTQLADVA
jgi:hypothetical protein